MPEIKVIFADGSVAQFHEQQTFVAINNVVKSNGNEYLDKSNTYGLWSNTKDGLVFSFIDLLKNALFFFDVEKPNIIYATSAIVKIELDDKSFDWLY